MKIHATLSDVNLVYSEKISISVPLCLENLVGSVIKGKRLNEASVSKKVLQNSCSFTFKIFIYSHLLI